MKTQDLGEVDRGTFDYFPYLILYLQFEIDTTLNPGPSKDLRIVLNTSFIAFQEVNQEIPTHYSGGRKTWIAS
jgi:hypothetical protein